MTRCAGCGYFREAHDLLGKCPLCACGEMPVAHDLLADGERGCPCACGRPPLEHLAASSCGCRPAEPHSCRWALWLGEPCSGRRSKTLKPGATRGEWLKLRRATFREPEPEQVRRDWFGLLVPVVETKAEQVEQVEIGPPIVPARPPLTAAEYATSNRGMSAAKLGRKAAALGWAVAPAYWVGFDHSEGCALRLAKPPLRAVALWRRPAADAGKLTGWKTDVAYAWRTDVARFPTKLTHTDLERLIQ